MDVTEACELKKIEVDADEGVNAGVTEGTGLDAEEALPADVLDGKFEIDEDNDTVGVPAEVISEELENEAKDEGVGEDKENGSLGDDDDTGF